MRKVFSNKSWGRGEILEGVASSTPSVAAAWPVLTLLAEETQRPGAIPVHAGIKARLPSVLRGLMESRRCWLVIKISICF